MAAATAATTATTATTTTYHPPTTTHHPPTTHHHPPPPTTLLQSELYYDLRDGVVLAHLLELLSGMPEEGQALDGDDKGRSDGRRGQSGEALRGRLLEVDCNAAAGGVLLDGMLGVVVESVCC